MSQHRYTNSKKGRISQSEKYQQRTLNQAWIKTRWRMTLLITSYSINHLFVTDSRLCNFPQQLRFFPLGACILRELCQDTLRTRLAKHIATCLSWGVKSQGSESEYELRSGDQRRLHTKQVWTQAGWCVHPESGMQQYVTDNTPTEGSKSNRDEALSLLHTLGLSFGWRLQ